MLSAKILAILIVYMLTITPVINWLNGFFKLLSTWFDTCIIRQGLSLLRCSEVKFVLNESAF